MAFLTFFGLSAPLTTTFTCFGTMMGTNNTDIYEWNVNIKGIADSVWSQWGTLDRLGRWEMYVGSASSILLIFTITCAAVIIRVGFWLLFSNLCSYHKYSRSYHMSVHLHSPYHTSLYRHSPFPLQTHEKLLISVTF
jgi:hypothetical protein